MKKWYQILPALVFVVFLAAMSLVLLFSPTKDYSENEKRYLSGRPEVTVQGIMKGETQKQLEKFTSDQIPGRNFFVGVNAYWNLATGRNAAQSIYHCADGYLINAPKPVNEQVFTDNLTRFDQFAAKLGVPADMIMVPTGGYLMNDVLPMFHKPYADDALYEKAGSLLTYTNLIDVRETLKEGAKNEQVCYRTDHHLTAYGNYLLYEAYQTAKMAPYLSRDSYEVETHDGFYGTTWSGSGYWGTKPDAVELWKTNFTGTVTIADTETDTMVYDSLFFPSHLQEMDKYPTYLDGNHSMVILENPQAEGGSLLVIRDSYAHCTGTFLASNYKKIYMVDLRYYRKPLSEFIASHPVDQLLYLYGMDNLVSDTNSAWLS